MTDKELNLVQLKELKIQLSEEDRFIGARICQNAIDYISNQVDKPVKHAKNVKDYEWLDNELETILFEMQDGNATKEETKNKLFEYIFEDLVNEIQKLKDSSLSV